MSGETIQRRSRLRTTLSWAVRALLFCGVLVLSVAFTGSISHIQVLFHFLLGWAFHTKESFPVLTGNWRAFLLPLGCLLLAVLLIHRFACRWLEAKGSARRLRPVQTLAATTLVLLGGGAAIALSGVVHQAIWLMGDPWFQSNRRVDLTYTVNNARQVLMVLIEYHDDNNHYPNSLQELDFGFSSPQQLVWVRTSTSKVPEPFILFHPGRARAADAHEPLIISPVIPGDRKFVVGYGDMSIRTLPESQLGQILEQRGKSISRPASRDE